MRTIVRRLLRLEVLATPLRNERGETLAEVVAARRKRRLEESGEAFADRPLIDRAGVRSIREILLRGRRLYREAARHESALEA